MKKVFLIILTLFVLTGCSATYNLEIDDSRVLESCDFLLEKNDENERTVDDYYNTNYLAFFDMNLLKDYNYNKERIDDGKHVGMNLSFAYGNRDYQNSSLLDRCYYKKSFIKTNDYIILNTEGGASCFYKDESKLLDDLTVNIKTDLKVLENNADSVKDNVYTWKLTDKNFSKKNIYIKIKRGSVYSFIPLIIILIVFIIVLINYIRIRFINKRKNEI